MKLLPHETDLLGGWISVNGRTSADVTETRINSLIASYLEKVASSSDGWDQLYLDPEDRRFWELTFPQSGMHGGGPKRLTNISPELAPSKYQDNSTAFLDLR